MTTTLQKEILAALESVKDPEIPVLSVVDLGIVKDISADENQTRITITPTFVGCPAIDFMRNQIKKAAEDAGYKNVEVIIDREHKWSTNDISERGKKLLQEFRISPPAKIKDEVELNDLQVSCPNCGSSNTTLNSLFGSTLCRALHYCFDCKQGFEAFKPK